MTQTGKGDFQDFPSGAAAGTWRALRPATSLAQSMGVLPNIPQTPVIHSIGARRYELLEGTTFGEPHFIRQNEFAVLSCS